MDGTATLSISSEKVCYIIAKARQFVAKDVVADPDSGSNAADDKMVDVLEDQADDPVVVLGEIAHIVAESPQGPRGGPVLQRPGGPLP